MLVGDEISAETAVIEQQPASGAPEPEVLTTDIAIGKSYCLLFTA